MPLMTEAEYKKLLRPVCRVPASALASEVCDADTAGERTDEGLEDLDAATLEEAVVAGFTWEETGRGTYQDGWHSVVDPATATIRRDRLARRTKEAAMAKKKSDCDCNTNHVDEDDYDLLGGNLTPAGARRRANAELGQPASGVAAASAPAAHADSPDDTDEEAAMARLRAANAGAWTGR